jgi:hypothetical protein
MAAEFAALIADRPDERERHPPYRRFVPDLRPDRHRSASDAQAAAIARSDAEFAMTGWVQH